MDRYGKHPRLSLEEDDGFQSLTETHEWVFPLVPTAEKEEREEAKEVEEEEEEENNMQEQEEDNNEKEEEEEDNKQEQEEVNNEKEEDEEEKGEEEEKEENADEVDEEEHEKGEEEADITSIFFSTSNTTPSLPPPSPSASSTSSLFSLLDVDLLGNEMLNIFQNAQSFFPSSILGINLNEILSDQINSPGGNQASDDPEALLNLVIQEKATDLVFLFIYKYRVKEPITVAEINEVITKEYESHFPVIFMEASRCLELTFGIDVKESDILNSAYVFVNSLNLTYEDLLNDNDSLPRNAFLIVILGVIFIEGNCASEERIWEFLKLVGVHDGEEHFICGNPREFLTVELVQQNYLEFREVPDRNPPCFEFLWGSRATAETTKMKVLEFLAKLNACEAIDFSAWYEEALRDEEERAWALHDSVDGSPINGFIER